MSDLKITKEFLTSKHACADGLEYFENNFKEGINVLQLIEHLQKENKFTWINWLIARVLNKENRVKYAIYAAELVLYLFEKKYPDDDRPKKAIEAAKSYLENQNNAAAYSAAYTAAAAAYSAYAAANAAAAAYSAYAYAAAYAAAYADAAAAAYAAAAYAAAAYADAAAKIEIQSKIINFGIILIKQQEKL